MKKGNKKEKMKKEDKNEEINEEENKHHVETFLGGVPFLGGFFKELGKADVFKERFREVNQKIEENLKKGERKDWVVESRLSFRPLFEGRFEGRKHFEKDSSTIVMKEDYWYEKKGDKLILAVKVPSEDVIVRIKEKNLLVNGPNFNKSIELPNYFKNIKKKGYKKGVLAVELTK
ncbi:MAG: hypothetical protein KJ955_00115 [Nanoarchaeota archaeon]|nr:hypothetical protein [Nanoarchaeota archaeon]